MALERLDYFRDMLCAREVEESVNVVGCSADGKRWTTRLTKDSTQVGMCAKHKVILSKERMALFRRKDEMHQQTRKGLRHTSNIKYS